MYWTSIEFEEIIAGFTSRFIFGLHYRLFTNITVGYEMIGIFFKHAVGNLSVEYLKHFGIFIAWNRLLGDVEIRGEPNRNRNRISMFQEPSKFFDLR